MWGWKPVERQIETETTMDTARAILKNAGFDEHVSTEAYVSFKRSGTELAISGEKFPLELAVAKTDSGLFIQLRYDTFALFDTGDLAKVADGIVEQLN